MGKKKKATTAAVAAARKGKRKPKSKIPTLGGSLMGLGGTGAQGSMP
jgi:hypothetical protein